MNTDSFTIDSADIELAQNICKLIDNSDVRNRAVANAIAGRVAAKYFDSEVYNIDSESGLHNIGAVLQDIDISDIYINNLFIDVRVLFNEEEIAIPSEQIDNGIVPLAYMFIKITPDISGATVIGFKNPENIDKSHFVDGYYRLNEEELESFYDIEPLLTSFNNNDDITVDDSEIFAYLDNTLDDKYAFYSKLVKSKDARLRLAKAAKAQVIFNFVSVNNVPKEKVLDDTSSTELVLEDTGSLEIEDLSEELQLTDFSIDSNDNNEIIEDTYDNNLSEDTLNTADEFTGFSENAGAENTINSSELTEEDLDLSIGEGISQDLSAESSESASTNDKKELDELSLDHTEYTTVTSPSLKEADDVEDFERYEGYSTGTNNSETDSTASNDQIEALFNNTSNEDDLSSEEDTPGLKVYGKKQAGKASVVKPLLILTLLIVAGAVGYTCYSKFLTTPPANEDTMNSELNNITTNNLKTNDAMPNETVESDKVVDNRNEAVSSASIPAIEQNLDASILVSNLRVDWEVPAGYASNTSAKRYLVKLGKIIQLNLKTELLLLSKPPITNKIGVEIKYNTNTRKFEATGISISSGEQSVDDLILKTVNKALAMNLSMNTDSFAKLQGNPILIIHL